MTRRRRKGTVPKGDVKARRKLIQRLEKIPQTRAGKTQVFPSTEEMLREDRAR